jgi:hypothetical protein
MLSSIGVLSTLSCPLLIGPPSTLSSLIFVIFTDFLTSVLKSLDLDGLKDFLRRFSLGERDYEILILGLLTLRL